MRAGRLFCNICSIVYIILYIYDKKLIAVQDNAITFEVLMSFTPIRGVPFLGGGGPIVTGREMTACCVCGGDLSKVHMSVIYVIS